MSAAGTVLAAVRRQAALRPHPELPVVDARATVVAAVSSALFYLLLAGWLLPGTADVVAALPVGAQLGVLLLLGTATRFLAGWLSARRFRSAHGLPGRLVAMPSAAMGGLAGFLLVAVVAVLGGADASWGAVLLDAVRWPVEAAVGALLAFPDSAASAGERGHENSHHGSRPFQSRTRRAPS